MMDWQPIESAPRDGTFILLWPCTARGGKEIVAQTGYWHQPGNPETQGFWSISSGYSQRGLRHTHWQPLPAPPAPLPPA